MLILWTWKSIFSCFMSLWIFCKFYALQRNDTILCSINKALDWTYEDLVIKPVTVYICLESICSILFSRYIQSMSLLHKQREMMTSSVSYVLCNAQLQYERFFFIIIKHIICFYVRQHSTTKFEFWWQQGLGWASALFIAALKIQVN